MNPNNYASLEASKRLIEAGIEMETERYWYRFFSVNEENKECWRLTWDGDKGPVPAPSMSEVWRELPPQGCYLTANQGYYYAWIEWTDFEGHGKSSEAKENTNPTDALIDLLIWTRWVAAWLRKEAKPC